MFVSWMNTVTEDPAMFITGCFYCVGENMFMFPLKSVYKELHADHETGAADNK